MSTSNTSIKQEIQLTPTAVHVNFQLTFSQKRGEYFIIKVLRCDLNMVSYTYGYMIILQCLTYGCQTWALTEELTRKINVCQTEWKGVKRQYRMRLENM